MRTEGKRKWLVIAHCMNMDGQAASHHVSDKLPYLRNVGIEPILLSAASGSKDLNFEHHQVFSPAPSGLKFEMRHYLRKRISNKHIAESLIAFFTIIILPFFLVEKIFIRYDSQWSWFLTASGSVRFDQTVRGRLLLINSPHRNTNC